MAIGTNHGILSNRNGTNIQHGQIVIGIEMLSQMDVDAVIHKNLTIEIEVVASRAKPLFDDGRSFFRIHLLIKGFLLLPRGFGQSP